MNLGQFSVSLTVKDIAASLEFYEKFGFEVIDGGHMNEAFADSDTHKWRILKNDSAAIGLFQGMFDENILTSTPKTCAQYRSRSRNPELNSIQKRIWTRPDHAAQY